MSRSATTRARLVGQQDCKRAVQKVSTKMESSNEQLELSQVKRWQRRRDRKRKCIRLMSHDKDKTQMCRHSGQGCLAPRSSFKLKISHYQRTFCAILLMFLSSLLLVEFTNQLSPATTIEPHAATTIDPNQTKKEYQHQKQVTNSNSDNSGDNTNNNNQTAPTSDEHTSEFKYILTLVYLIIFIIGVCGNICNCLVIADSRNRYMKTATNYYLFSLSISDLLLLTFGLPHDIVNLWYPSPYLFNSFVCISRGWISEASTYASVLVIVAFTVERYLAICHPLRAHTLSRLSRSIKIIILIWLVASSCALVVVWQFGIQETIVETIVDVEEIALPIASASSSSISSAAFMSTPGPAHVPPFQAALGQANAMGPANFESSPANMLAASASLSTVATSIALHRGNRHLAAPNNGEGTGALALAQTIPQLSQPLADIEQNATGRQYLTTSRDNSLFQLDSNNNSVVNNINNDNNKSIDLSLVSYKNNTRHQVVQRKSIAQCTTVALNEKIFELSVLIFFILPMTIITILYLKLGCYLRQKTSLIKQNRLNRERNMSQHHHQQDRNNINNNNSNSNSNNNININNKQSIEEFSTNNNNNYNTNISRSSLSYASIIPDLMETTTAFISSHLPNNLSVKRAHQSTSNHLPSTPGNNKSIELEDISFEFTNDTTTTITAKRSPNGNQAVTTATLNSSQEISKQNASKSNSSNGNKRQHIKIKVTQDDGQEASSGGRSRSDFRDHVKRSAMTIARCCVVHSDQQIGTTVQQQRQHHHQQIRMNPSNHQNEIHKPPELELDASSANGKQLINQQSSGEQTNSGLNVAPIAAGSCAPHDFPPANNVQRKQERKLINQRRSPAPEIELEPRESVNEKSTFNRLCDCDIADGNSRKTLTRTKPSCNHHGMCQSGVEDGCCLINCAGAEKNSTVQITQCADRQIEFQGKKSTTTKSCQQLVLMVKNTATNSTIPMTNDRDMILTRDKDGHFNVDLDKERMVRKKQPGLKGSNDSIDPCEVRMPQNINNTPFSTSVPSLDNYRVTAQRLQSVVTAKAKPGCEQFCSIPYSLDGSDRLSPSIVVDVQKNGLDEQSGPRLDTQRGDLKPESKDDLSASRVTKGWSENQLARTRTLGSIADEVTGSDKFPTDSGLVPIEIAQLESTSSVARKSISMNELKSNHLSPVLKTTPSARVVKQIDHRYTLQLVKQNHQITPSISPTPYVLNSKRHSSGFALNSTVNTSSMQAVIKMLVSVVVMFFICWAPFHAQRLMAIYVREPTNEQVFVYNLLNHISGVSYYISAVANPILYSLLLSSQVISGLALGVDEDLSILSRLSEKKSHDSLFGGVGGDDDKPRVGVTLIEDDLSMLEDDIKSIKRFVNTIKAKSIAPDRALTLPLSEALFCGKIIILGLWDVIPNEDFPYQCCLLPFAPLVLPPCKLKKKPKGSTTTTTTTTTTKRPTLKLTIRPTSRQTKKSIPSSTRSPSKILSTKKPASISTITTTTTTTKSPKTTTTKGDGGGGEKPTTTKRPITRHSINGSSTFNHTPDPLISIDLINLSESTTTTTTTTTIAPLQESKSTNGTRYGRKRKRRTTTTTTSTTTTTTTTSRPTTGHLIALEF